MRVHSYIHPLAGIALATGLVLAIAPAAAVGVSEGWTRQFGSADYDSGHASAVDGNRNVYVAGSVKGALPGKKARGGRDAFVRKYQPGGGIVWTRQFGTSGDESVSSVAVDKDGNVIVAGSVSGKLQGQKAKGGDDAFVRKYRANGKHVWTRQFGTAGADYAVAVAVDRWGNVLVAGRTSGKLWGQTAKGGGDAFLRKYRANGKHVWMHQLGTTQNDGGDAVAVDRQGNVYVAGSTDGAMTRQLPKGLSDAFLRKYRANGTAAWTRQFGTAGREGVADLAVDAQGRVFAVGWTDGTFSTQTSKGLSDAFVRRFKSTGEHVWTRQIGTGGWDSAAGVAIDRGGKIYVAGTRGGGLANHGDAFVRKMRRDRTMAWNRNFGSKSAEDDAEDVSVDRLGNVSVIGTTEGTLPGKKPPGGGDAFIRVYRP